MLNRIAFTPDNLIRPSFTGAKAALTGKVLQIQKTTETMEASGIKFIGRKSDSEYNERVYWLNNFRANNSLVHSDIAAKTEVIRQLAASYSYKNQKIKLLQPSANIPEN